MHELHRVLAAIAALSSLSRASPLRDGPEDSHPPFVSGNAFALVAVPSDPSRDLSPTVHGQVVGSVHVGAALDAVALYPPGGRVFYANGNASTVPGGLGTVVSDQAGFPQGLAINDDGNGQGGARGPVQPTSMNVGLGTPGVHVVKTPKNRLRLTAPGAGTFAVCVDTLPYYGPDIRFRLLKWVEGFGGMAGIPAACVPVELLPRCTELNALPDGAVSNHDSVYKTCCYPDPAAIDWSDYE